MTKFEVVITLESEAFRDDLKCGTELASILRQLANSVDRYNSPGVRNLKGGPLFDSNKRQVGAWSVV
jgi:hypothetical protein